MSKIKNTFTKEDQIEELKYTQRLIDELTDEISGWRYSQNKSWWRFSFNKWCKNEADKMDAKLTQYCDHYNEVSMIFHCEDRRQY